MSKVSVSARTNDREVLTEAAEEACLQDLFATPYTVAAGSVAYAYDDMSEAHAVYAYDVKTGRWLWITEVDHEVGGMVVLCHRPGYDHGRPVYLAMPEDTVIAVAFGPLDDAGEPV